MATSVISVVMLLFLIVASQIETVFSAGSTIIKSSSGWTSVEGANFTLSCWVSRSDSVNADTLCRTRIRFTKNSTIIAEDSRHVRSGAIRDGQNNRINCTMTMFRLQSEDSGWYGCCWPTAEGNCSRHPTQMLKVMPATTLAPTTIVSTSSSDQTTRSRTPSESNAVVYQSISMRSGPTSSGGENEALIKGSGASLHKTMWPILLILAVLAIIIVFGIRYVKRKSADRHSVPAEDQEIPGRLSPLQDHSVTYDVDGVLATTTTTTTTTTVLKQTPEEDSER